LLIGAATEAAPILASLDQTLDARSQR